MMKLLCAVAGVVAFAVVAAATGTAVADVASPLGRVHHAVRSVTPSVAPRDVVEVQGWSDGVAELQVWCLAPDGNSPIAG